MKINVPILIGAFVAVLVKKSTKKEKLSKARSNKGILIASGLIAGGAIMEVLVSLTGAVDQLASWKVQKPIQRITEGVAEIADGTQPFVGKIMPFLDISGRMIDGGINPDSLARVQNWLALLVFLALCTFVFWDCCRAKPDESADLTGH
jgi:hypothetical protein